MNSIEFSEPLTEGTISKRNGQYIIIVNVNGKEINCHCPTTGRIGDIELSGRPCLMSKSKDPHRKTPYTVEAISLNRSEDPNKTWIGINQNAINRYVEHYLRNGGLSDIIGSSGNIQREKFLGDSKLDFLMDDTYIEVKMPLQTIQIEIPKYIKIKKVTPFSSTDRFVRHITELSNSLQDHQRAILLNCFIYDNPGFKVINRSTNFEEVSSSVKRSTEAGMEMWQINFEITPEAVRLIRYFKLNFEDI